MRFAKYGRTKKIHSHQKNIIHRSLRSKIMLNKLNFSLTSMFRRTRAEPLNVVSNNKKNDLTATQDQLQLNVEQKNKPVLDASTSKMADIFTNSRISSENIRIGNHDLYAREVCVNDQYEQHQPFSAKIIDPKKNKVSFDSEVCVHYFDPDSKILNNNFNSSSEDFCLSEFSATSDSSDSSEETKIAEGVFANELGNTNDAIQLANRIGILNEQSSQDNPLMPSERVHRLRKALNHHDGGEVEKSILIIKELEAFSTQGTQETTDETLGRVNWKNQLTALVEEYTNGGDDSKLGKEAQRVLQELAKVMGKPSDWLSPLKRILNSNNISEANKSKVLIAELQTISQPNNQETIKEILARIDWQTQLVALVNEYTTEHTTNGKKRKLGKEATDVLLALAKAMGNLHAGKLGDSWHYKEVYFSSDKLSEEWNKFKKRRTLNPAIRSPQMDAHKILKRYRESLIALHKTRKYLGLSSSPDAAIEFVGRVWEEKDTIKSLSRNRRSLSEKDVIKTGTAIALTGTLLTTSHFLGEALAGMDIFPFHFNTPIDLQQAQAHIAHLHQQYADQTQRIAHLNNQANTTLSAIQPGSPECEALYSALHPDGTPTAQLFSVDNWQTAYQQLNNVDISNLDATTTEFVLGLQGQAHDIVEAMQVRETTGAVLQAVQDQLPGLEQTSLAAEAVAVQEHHALVSKAAMGVTEITAEATTAGIATAASHRYAIGKASQSAIAQNKSFETKKTNWDWRKGIRTAAKFKQDYIGNPGVIGMTVGASKFLFGDAGSSPQHAEIRDSIAALVEARKLTSTEYQTDILEKLGVSWANMTSALSKDVPPKKQDLDLADQVNILNTCIKELDPQNFDAAHRKRVNELRKAAISKAPEGALKALLPKMEKHTTSYIWLVQYLLSGSNKLGEALSQKEVDIVKDKLEKFASSNGAIGHLQNKLALKAQLLKAKTIAANYRPDLGIIGGVEGKKYRIKVIEEGHTEQKNYIHNKQAKLKNAIKDLQEITRIRPFQVDQRSPRSIADMLASRVTKVAPVSAINHSNPDSIQIDSRPSDYYPGYVIEDTASLTSSSQSSRNSFTDSVYSSIIVSSESESSNSQISINLDNEVLDEHDARENYESTSGTAELEIVNMYVAST